MSECIESTVALYFLTNVKPQPLFGVLNPAVPNTQR